MEVQRGGTGTARLPGEAELNLHNLVGVRQHRRASRQMEQYVQG